MINRCDLNQGAFIIGELTTLVKEAVLQEFERKACANGKFKLLLKKLMGR